MCGKKKFFHAQSLREIYLKIVSCGRVKQHIPRGNRTWLVMMFNSHHSCDPGGTEFGSSVEESKSEQGRVGGAASSKPPVYPGTIRRACSRSLLSSGR